MLATATSSKLGGNELRRVGLSRKGCRHGELRTRKYPSGRPRRSGVGVWLLLPRRSGVPRGVLAQELLLLPMKEESADPDPELAVSLLSMPTSMTLEYVNMEALRRSMLCGMASPEG